MAEELDYFVSDLGKINLAGLDAYSFGYTVELSLAKPFYFKIAGAQIQAVEDWCNDNFKTTYPHGWGSVQDTRVGVVVFNIYDAANAALFKLRF